MSRGNHVSNEARDCWGPANQVCPTYDEFLEHLISIEYDDPYFCPECGQLVGSTGRLVPCEPPAEAEEIEVGS